MQPDSLTSITQLQARVAELEACLAEREDSAHAHNKLLGELLDNSLANVFAADRTMRLVAINRTARETFQRHRGFLPQIGDYVPQFLTNQPDIMNRLAPVWPRVLAGEAFVDTVTFGPPDAPRHYEIRYTRCAMRTSGSRADTCLPMTSPSASPNSNACAKPRRLCASRRKWKRSVS